MGISDNLLTLFSGQVEKHGDSYVVEIPKRELDVGDIRKGDVYRVGVYGPARKASKNRTTAPQQTSQSENPPVEEGEVIDVEIENMGDQGDGIARVGPGYVVIVSGTDVGERVAAKITEARENVAFADVVKHYDRRQ
ncbi:TRAM domain-containing protein [Halanaeroarchaeum sulfurireducens]|nr:TRAM domain-containing protein [Halanaeroarchaeum sulfurireducens]